MVTGEGKGEDGGGLGGDATEEITLDLGGERDVEDEQRDAERFVVGVVIERFVGKVEYDSEVGEAFVSAVLFEGCEEGGEVEAGRPGMGGEVGGSDAFEAEFGEGGGYGGAESGGGGDGCEVGDLVSFVGGGDDAGGEGFDG